MSKWNTQLWRQRQVWQHDGIIYLCLSTRILGRWAAMLWWESLIFFLLELNAWVELNAFSSFLSLWLGWSRKHALCLTLNWHFFMAPLTASICQRAMLWCFGTNLLKNACILMIKLMSKGIWHCVGRTLSRLSQLRVSNNSRYGLQQLLRIFL